MKRQILRKIIQGLTAAGANAYLPGFWEGDIFRGASKHVCVPGLNCYSCPSALGACPVGSLQNALSGGKKNGAWYVAGLIALYGLLMGRWICGWLCPFGLIQELLYKIPAPRLRVPRRLRPLRFLKYAVLAVLVILLPLTLVNAYGQGSPWFCKLLCPAGTLTAALPLMAAAPALLDAAGALFVLKMTLAALIVAGCLMIPRFFCRFLCPLGALYGLFNRIALVRYRVDSGRCTHCGACARACPMDLDPLRNPNGADCIRCGKCLDACPTGALRRERLSFPGRKRPENGE